MCTYVHTVREEKTNEQSLTLSVFCSSLAHNYIRGLKAFSGGLLLGIYVRVVTGYYVK